MRLFARIGPPRSPVLCGRLTAVRSKPLSLAAAASLVALLTVSLLWVRSYTRGEDVSYTSLHWSADPLTSTEEPAVQTRIYMMASGRGGVLIGRAYNQTRTRFMISER